MTAITVSTTAVIDTGPRATPHWLVDPLTELPISSTHPLPISPVDATGAVIGGNPAVVSSTTITAATAAPSTVAGLAADSYITIAAGTVDAVTARITSLGGGAPTVQVWGTDDGSNLYLLSGLPISATIGAGQLTQSMTAVGASSYKGSGVRAIYMIVTALGGGTNIGLELSATPNQSRVTSIVRGSLGGSISGAIGGTAPSEAVTVQGAAGGTAIPITSSSVTPTDKSGTITAGGTAQTAIASNASRKGFWIQNLSTGDLWISSLATAVQSQPSMRIRAGALYESPYGGTPTGAISIIGATTGQAFAAREW